MPPVMQRPRCSMKLPKIFLSISPRCRPLWIWMVAEAADALPGTRNGADAEAANTVLREIFMPLPDLVLLSLRLLLREITLQRAPASSHTQYDRLDGRAEDRDRQIYSDKSW